MIEGWATSTLDDILGSDGIFVDGDWVESKDQDPNGEVRLIQLADIGDGVFKDKSERYLTLEKAHELNCTFLSKDDVLVARMPDPLGRACQFPLEGDEKYCTVVDVCVVRPDQKVADGKFLTYWLNTPQMRYEVDVRKSGSTRKRIARKKLASIEFNLPPLPEQKCIVAKIEALFAELDAGVEQLKAVKAQLQTYRQAVLQYGMSGLVGDKKTDLYNPIVIGSPPEGSIPEGWSWQLLPQVAKLESGHTPRKTVKEYWDDGDIPWICLQDIRAANGKVIQDTKYHPTQLGIDNSSARMLPEGTVCFSRDISVGFVTIMGKEMATTQHFANWICGDDLDNAYLMNAFMASKDSLVYRGQGSTVKTIYMPELKQMHILLPPVKEQTQIVREIESRLSVAEALEQTISTSLEQAEVLRQSILKKAFEGRLVEHEELV